MADKDGHWIEHANLRKGSLHKSLGIPAGKNIPASRLKTALASRNPRIKRMATLAHTFAKFRP